MRVKVKSCAFLDYWYADKIGHEFNVDPLVLNGDFAIINHSGSRLLASDCEIIPEEKKELESISSDEWCEGDVIELGDIITTIIAQRKDGKLVLKNLKNGLFDYSCTEIELRSVGYKKVHPKLKVTQEMLIECYLKTNNLTEDRIEIV